MNDILLLIYLIIIFLTFIRPVYGIGSFLAVRILVPEVARMPGLEMLSYNSAIILIVLIIVIVKNFQVFYKCLLYDKYFKVLLLFIIISAILLPLSDYANLKFQYSYLLQYFFTDILPILLSVIVIKNQKDLSIVINIFLYASIICCVYAIITYVLQFNIYVNYFQAINGWRDVELGERLWYTSGRGVSTSGTFLHANGFGYFISMAIPICTYLLSVKKYNRFILVTTLVLLIINLFLCKKRSPIVSIGVFLIFWLYYNQILKNNIKLFFKIMFLLFLLFVIIFSVPAFDNIKTMIETSVFFWDDDLLAAKDVGGSSWELRILQALYPFVEIKNNILFGKGFGWCAWYLNEYELHPVLFGFETILSTAVCQFGITGYFIYYVLFRQSYKYSKPYKVIGINYQLLALIAMIVLVIATGLNYFFFYGIGVVFMNKHEHIFYKHEKSINSYSKLQLRR